MDQKKVINHFLQLSQGLRQKKICEDELQQIVERDVNNFHTMMQNKVITYQEYESLLVMVEEFEDLFIEIIKTQSNGQV